MIPMIPVTFDRTEGRFAVLRTEDKQELLWEREQLPREAKPGDTLHLTLLRHDELDTERKRLAKDLLNEMLTTDTTTA